MREFLLAFSPLIPQIRIYFKNNDCIKSATVCNYSRHRFVACDVGYRRIILSKILIKHIYLRLTIDDECLEFREQNNRSLKCKHALKLLLIETY
jgi:hypothetical protein